MLDLVSDQAGYASDMPDVAQGYSTCSWATQRPQILHTGARTPAERMRFAVHRVRVTGNVAKLVYRRRETDRAAQSAEVLHPAVPRPADRMRVTTRSFRPTGHISLGVDR
jgi:hypothetical protein